MSKTVKRLIVEFCVASVGLGLLLLCLFYGTAGESNRSFVTLLPRLWPALPCGAVFALGELIFLWKALPRWCGRLLHFSGAMLAFFLFILLPTVKRESAGAEGTQVTTQDLFVRVSVYLVLCVALYFALLGIVTLWNLLSRAFSGDAEKRKGKRKV